MGLTGDTAAVCPSCGQHAPDAVGVPCPEKVCARKGYHYIPPEYVPETDALEVDPMVGRMVDEYLIVQTLGAGGFGKVFLVLQQPIMLKAALKLVHGHLVSGAMADRLLTKFRGEARALAQLTHPNIVRLLKFGVHQSSPYMVMEYVADAVTLAAEMADRALAGTMLTPREAKRVLSQVADGLGAAHKRGLVHRDVKPDNIMLQRIEGNAHFVRILDFGLAKDLTVSNETSVAMGTPAYMSPEQLRRKDLGPWTDWYAVGIMAYELLTGRQPFGEATGDSLFRMKLDAAYDPTAGLERAGLPRDTVAFLEKACAHEPEDRFATASEFRAGLDTAVAALEADGGVRAPSPALGLGKTQATPAGVNETVAATPPPDDEEQDPVAAARERLAREKQRLEEERAALEPAPAPLKQDTTEPTPLEDPDDAPPATEGSRSRVGFVAAALVMLGLGGGGYYLATSSNNGQGSAQAGIQGRTTPEPPAKPQPVTDSSTADGGSTTGTVSLSSAMTADAEGAPSTDAEAAADVTGPDADASPSPPSTEPEPKDLNAVVAVAAGDYPIGCQAGDARCWPDEKPGHTVALKGFRLMTYEVTVGAYADCVKAGACKAPGKAKGCPTLGTTPPETPIACVTWEDAKTFCARGGMRLPTEQEWEAAARGMKHPEFPWGDERPTCQHAVLKGCVTTGLAAPGHAARDKAWSGAHDMAGSVREWTASTHLPYPGSTAKKPRTARKAGKVTRGASWAIAPRHANSAHTRLSEAPEAQLPDLGFRCAGAAGVIELIK